MCVLVQAWRSGDGWFNDATQWRPTKIPKENAVVLVSGDKGAEVVVKKQYVHAHDTANMTVLCSPILPVLRIFCLSKLRYLDHCKCFFLYNESHV